MITINDVINVFVPKHNANAGITDLNKEIKFFVFICVSSKRRTETDLNNVHEIEGFIFYWGLKNL